jgi:hypothetical protein
MKMTMSLKAPKINKQSKESRFKIINCPRRQLNSCHAIDELLPIFVPDDMAISGISCEVIYPRTTAETTEGYRQFFTI